MPNPFFQQQNPQQFQQQPNIDINSLLQNPQLVMSTLAKVNPEAYQLLQSGGNPEQVLRNLCLKKGIDVNEVIQNVKALMGGNIRF